MQIERFFGTSERLPAGPTAPPPPPPAPKRALVNASQRGAPASAPKVVPADLDLVTIEGLTFRKHQAARIELSMSGVAGEEASFAQLLEAFLRKATSSREAINAKSEAVQVS